MIALLLEPEQVLSNYARAIDLVKPPPAYTFLYTFAHHGAHPQESEHQIFRQASNERDELVAFNGERLTHPAVRVFIRHRDPYDVVALAPRTGEYAFTYAGEARHGKEIDYVFNAFARGTPRYEVTRMVIDGKTFLPVEIEFHAKTATIDGTGKVTYARADRYWMPQSATARAQVRGSLETERIDWSRYQFYLSLPPSTFAEPRSQGGARAG